ncbi:hypothetical protein FF1_003420 [Malus domestica]
MTWRTHQLSFPLTNTTYLTLLAGSCKEQNALPLNIMKFTACRSLLNLLCHMPKGHLTSKSISLYVSSILNLERLLVGGLLDCQNALNSLHYHELFRLFVLS